MTSTARVILVSVAVAMSTQARAAQWWYVPGNSDGASVQFVDTDSLRRVGNRVSMIVLRIDHTNAQRASVQQFQCDGVSTRSSPEEVREFACGNEQTRMNTALILGSLTPIVAAHAIFAEGKGLVRRRVYIKATVDAAAK
jgi:hypothetical protein